MAEAEKLSLEIKRFIRAPRDRVYAAWTDPAQLKKWFGPENVKTRNLIADAWVGGQFRWDLTDPDGKELTISGEYREVLPSKKVAFTWHLEEDKIGKTTTASSRWNSSIERAVRRSALLTKSFQAKRHATITNKAGTVCSIK
jgi:uncharacterized protein YndB with AHSA1/START domain